MFKLIVLIAFCGAVLAVNGDDEHKQLHELAANIMQNLQKDHMPSDGSNNGAPNAPLHHMHNIGKNAMNSEYIDKTDKLKVSVGVKGIRFVSVERNGKVVNISAAFGVGAVALYTIDREDNEGIQYYNRKSEMDVEAEIDASLQRLSDEYLMDIPEIAGKNQTKILASQKAKYGLKVEQKSQHKNLKVSVDHGFIVGAVVNVTSNGKLN